MLLLTSHIKVFAVNQSSPYRCQSELCTRVFLSVKSSFSKALLSLYSAYISGIITCWLLYRSLLHQAGTEVYHLMLQCTRNSQEQTSDITEVAEAVFQLAMDRRSRDDVTIIVLDIQPEIRFWLEQQLINTECVVCCSVKISQVWTTLSLSINSRGIYV